ncbi:unnamed protein product [Schistosoma margrebowiei]|uniref:Uncharacterized protein n=1 Tax=Schistosoma margrebowiei TaxID=48269 RepID=A0A183LAF2_9TREM|nr:unnamed protein product [Schistosoma margrebowiei]
MRTAEKSYKEDEDDDDNDDDEEEEEEEEEEKEGKKGKEKNNRRLVVYILTTEMRKVYLNNLKSGFRRLIAIASANFKRLELNCLLLTLKDFSISTSRPVSRRCLAMALLAAFNPFNLKLFGICSLNRM